MDATRQGDKAIITTLFLYPTKTADRPSAWLAPLRDAVMDDTELAESLEARLDLKPNPAMEKMDAEYRRLKRENDARDRKQQKDRAGWIRTLQANLYSRFS